MDPDTGDILGELRELDTVSEDTLGTQTLLDAVDESTKGGWTRLDSVRVMGEFTWLLESDTGDIRKLWEGGSGET